MATASVIEKSLSPSPPPAASANCPCKTCLAVTSSQPLVAKPPEHAAVEIVDRKFTSDLEQIAYSVVMLVMEGRTPLEPEPVSPMTLTSEVEGSRSAKQRAAATIKEGHHSKQLSERLMHKIVNLNSGRSSMTTGQASVSVTPAAAHSCSTRNQQVSLEF